MRRALFVSLLVCISAITSGCGMCGRPPVFPQAYVAPACDPCATGAVVARPAAVVVPAPGPPAAVVVH